jgi:hypothetical protein
MTEFHKKKITNSNKLLSSMTLMLFNAKLMLKLKAFNQYVYLSTFCKDTRNGVHLIWVVFCWVAWNEKNINIF